LDEGDTSLQSFNHQLQFGKLKLNLLTSIGLQKINASWIGLKKLTHKLEESANFSISFTEFGHWMQKSQHFGFNLKLCEDTFGPLGW